jgi:hypothetical protein
MQPNDLVIIRSFDNVIDAYQVKNVLENEDIPVFITDENMVTLQPLYSNLLHGVKLKVRAEDLEAAEKVIKGFDEAILTDETDKRIACPKCHSVRVMYHLKSGKSAPGVFAILLSLFTGTYPLHSEDICRCKDCGCEFPMDKGY